MKKIKKKIIITLCMLTSLFPNNIKARDLDYYNFINQFSAFSISSKNRKYEKILEEAKKDRILTGYTIKKIKAKDKNSEKQVITGKIELVPIDKKYHDDWMRIMDCSDEENRKYLKWWTKNDFLNNESMEESFNFKVELTKINNNFDNYPRCANFMIKFYELDEPKTKEEIKNQKIKFKESKIVGFTGLTCAQENPYDTEQGNFVVSYIVDKNFQGKGIATEALQLITKLGSRLYQTGLFPFKSFVMYIACENKGSIKVAEKCGFRDAGPVPKEITNNLESHIWVKKDNSNRILDYLLKGKRAESILNELNIQKTDIVISCPSDDNKNNKNNKSELIDFNNWIENYANNKEFENYSGFEQIKNNLENLIKNENVIFHMKHSEWPIAWIKNNVFYSAIPDSLNEEIIKKVAHSFFGLECNCDNLF